MKIRSYRKVWISVIALVFFLSSCTTYSFKGTTPEAQEYLNKAREFPLEFNISKEEEYNAWGRAQSFVGTYCPMKLQIISDFVIETYNPSENRYGYHIIKTPTNNKLQISVQCTPGEYASKEIANDYAHICAYFIKTGIAPPDGIIKVQEEKELGIPIWSIFLGLGIVCALSYLVLHISVYK